jgi:hypothetical protein
MNPKITPNHLGWRADSDHQRIRHLAIDLVVEGLWQPGADDLRDRRICRHPTDGAVSGRQGLKHRQDVGNAESEAAVAVRYQHRYRPVGRMASMMSSGIRRLRSISSAQAAIMGVRSRTAASSRPAALAAGFSSIVAALWPRAGRIVVVCIEGLQVQ